LVWPGVEARVRQRLFHEPQRGRLQRPSDTIINACLFFCSWSLANAALQHVVRQVAPTHCLSPSIVTSWWKMRPPLKGPRLHLTQHMSSSNYRLHTCACISGFKARDEQARCQLGSARRCVASTASFHAGRHPLTCCCAEPGAPQKSAPRLQGIRWTLNIHICNTWRDSCGPSCLASTNCRHHTHRISSQYTLTPSLRIPTPKHAPLSSGTGS
jgi:hypothetical protein